MKKIFTFLTAALFAASLWGTEVQIVSGGTANTNVPLSNAGSYYICQFIIPANLLSSAPSTEHNISSISFNYAVSKKSCTRKLKVYMSNTSDSEYSGYFGKTFAVSSADKVFAGSITTPTAMNNFYSIPFDKKFAWDGTSNILVTVIDSTGEVYSSLSHYAKSGYDNKCVYRTVTSNINPTGQISSCTKCAYLPEMKLNFCAAGLQGPTDVTITGTSTTATISWTKPAEATSIKLQYVKNGETDTTTVSDITASSYKISGLSAGTKYDCKIYAVYSAGISAPVYRSFVTPAAPAPTYDAPTSVSVLSKSSSTATIGWTKNDSATIKLQYKVQGAGSWIDSVGITGNSKQLNGLSAETTYDYQVFAVYPTGISSAVGGSFTTAAAPAPSDHEHDGISFVAWNETASLPTSAGNYYLKNNVTVSSWTLPSGDIKICLNGKTITFSSGYGGYISVGPDKNLSIYDNEGDGAITVSQNFNAAIRVTGGTLSLFGGSINNTASGTDASVVHVGSGTFNIKGNVKMSTSGSAANIRLANYYAITLVGAITNSTKLSVSKDANRNITSGWSTQMGSADPADFFTSKNSDAPAVILVGGEAQLGVPSVTISETGTNTIENGKLANVDLVRTFQANILNTIALPFALDNEKLAEAFGADYELFLLSSSSLSAGVLTLNFDKVTTLDSGKPYLLRISEEVANPSFSSVTLKTATQSVVKTGVTMMPVISEKELDGNEGNLFLNSAGELNWSTSKAPFKGMRAYFRVDNPSAVSVRRISLGTNAATDLDNLEVSDKAVKRIVNGQLVIERNGVRYDLNGQIIKMTK